MSLLFVYGTLRRGAKTGWSEVLEESSRFIGMGTVSGELFLVRDYPGMIASAMDRRVTGDVFRIDDAGLWSKLDEYEGDEFERRMVLVHMTDGSKLEACAYFYVRDTAGKTRIESGDYLAGTA